MVNEMRIKPSLLLSFLLIGALIGSIYVQSTIATTLSTSHDKSITGIINHNVKLLGDDDDDGGGNDNGGNHDGGTSDNETMPENGENETHDMDEEHMLQYEYSGDNVNIKSYDNQIKMYLDKPKFKFEYQNDTTEVRFEFKVKKVIEFNDSNSNLMIDEGEILYEVDP